MYYIGDMAYAEDFYGIPEVLRTNSSIKNRFISLVNEKSIHGKSVDGQGRVDDLKSILVQIAIGELELEDSYDEVESKLARDHSPYSKDNRTFSSRWAERLVRTQLSRFYNQSVLELLIESGESSCYVPNSVHEKPESKCSSELAGQNHSCKALLNRLEATYEDADYSDRSPKVPNHPYCTHVITTPQ